MSAYRQIGLTWKQRKTRGFEAYLRQVAIRWRREPSIKRVEKPTRIDRARQVGYKAKQGFVVVRVRIRKGGARKPRPRSGRRPKALGAVKFSRALSLRAIAQARVVRRFPNLRPLNSYFVWEDGRSKWFETILIDTSHHSIKSDKNVSHLGPQ